MAHSVLDSQVYLTELSDLSTKEPMQILVLPTLQIIIMAKAFFELAEPFGVGHFAAITRLHSKIVMKHFMINDTCNDIFRDIAPV
jgi:hypothetical protein